MKKLFAALHLIAFASLAQAGNYATCLLDKMPRLQNDNAATAAWNLCKSQHPAGLSSVS